MPTESELNQFKRYIGDYGQDTIDDDVLESYLDDSTFQLTSDFVNEGGASQPVTDFDTLSAQYKPEAIVKAAIDWWWNYASDQVEKHTTTVGQASQNAGERWDRAMEMIARLTEYYGKIEQLGTDLSIGNLSRFSKSTLTRLGGRREEDIVNG